MTAHIEAASPHVMNTSGRLPIALSHGKGCRVWDVNGKQYLDGRAIASPAAASRHTASTARRLWSEPSTAIRVVIMLARLVCPTPPGRRG